jgi:two-component system sensor histidine kinase MprB
MSNPARGRSRTASLRWRLSVSFAGIAVLGALVIGLVLLPILASHYAMAERTYLEAAAERAVRDLSTMGWRDRAALRAQAEELALVTQARVVLGDPDGKVILEVEPPEAAPPSPAPPPLPNPLGGAGLFGGELDVASLPRSDQSISRPVNKPDKAGGQLIGYVRLSEAPAYEQVALLNVAQAWALASLLGVIVAAVVGLLVSDWLSRPLRELTAATDRMANGEQGVRAEVDRSDELGRLAASFNVMARRVEDTVASLRRFVADAAHEIGTPLTALQADLDLALEHADTADEQRLLGRALAQAERLGALASGLLRLSRLEAGDAPPAGERLDLASLAGQAADSFASRADQAGVELAFDAPPGPVPVAGDAERLGSAIGSLLDNAVKFTPAGGRVEIGVRGERGVARLWVSDTGIGIPEEDLGRLFDRFHRGRNVSSYPGSGLGLAIVRATAELHGGSVRATSDGTGARFELMLPIATP